MSPRSHATTESPSLLGRDASGAEGREPSRKEAVRDAALTLFAERGYHATTIKDIGSALNLRGPSLYNHIASKHDVLLDIVMTFSREGLAEQRRAVEGVDDAVERLRRLVDVHVRIHTRYRREAFVATRELASLEQPHRTRAIEYRAEYAGAIADAIARGMSSGAFATADARLATNAIIGMGVHIAWWFRSSGRLSEDELTAAYQQFALRLVQADERRVDV